MLIHPKMKVIDGHLIQISTTKLSKFLIRHKLCNYKEILRRRYPGYKIMYDFELDGIPELQFLHKTPQKLYIAHVYKVRDEVQLHRVGIFNSKEDAEKALANNARKVLCESESGMPHYEKAIIEEVTVGIICNKVNQGSYRYVWFYNVEKHYLDSEKYLYDYCFTPSHIDEEFPLWCLLGGYSPKN